MKLFYCMKCEDVVKIAGKSRQCECGACEAHLEDGYRHAVITKGEEYIVSMGLSVLSPIRTHMELCNWLADENSNVENTHPYDLCKKFPVKCWVRPNSGHLNPHTRIKDFGKD